MQILTKEEVIQEAIAYCLQSSKPNVIPNNSRLIEGYLGFTLIDSDADEAKDNIFFSIGSNPKNELLSAIDFINMYDESDGEFILYKNIVNKSITVFNKTLNSAYTMPQQFEQLLFVKPILDNCVKTSNLIYSDIIKQIVDKAFDTPNTSSSNPTNVPVEKPITPYTPTSPLNYVCETVTNGTDLITEFTSIMSVDNKLICVDYPESKDKLVIDIINSKAIRIASSLLEVSRVAKLVVDSIDSNWSIDNKYI